eukprot:Hpha_TRINITY_DN16135_c3_g3::TRINITY_DN16135_c3_g3_i1::g.8148::m.8148/K13412/CPK; calcium-dependent protein kinase
MGNCGSSSSPPGRRSAASGRGSGARAVAGVRAGQVASCKGDGVNEKYDIGREIGSGTFGVVYLAKDRGTGRQMAVKIVKITSEISLDQLHSERLMATLPHHPNLCPLLELFENPAKVTMVYPYCGGGEVLYSLQGRKHYNEGTAGVVIKAMMRGIAHLHDNRTAHLDIKPQNVVFVRPTDSDRPISVNDVQIIDFGSVTRFTPGRPNLTNVVGTPYFCPPEIILHLCASNPAFSSVKTRNLKSGLKLEPYDERCDVYAAGVVSHILLVGKHPLGNIGPKMPLPQFLETVLAGEQRSYPELNRLSYFARLLLSDTLVANFKQRARAQEVLESEWLAAIPETEGEACSNPSPVHRSLTDPFEEGFATQFTAVLDDMASFKKLKHTGKLDEFSSRAATDPVVHHPSVSSPKPLGSTKHHFSSMPDLKSEKRIILVDCEPTTTQGSRPALAT